MTLADLEAQWRSNGGHRPAEHAKRPASLRGPDMVAELSRLARLYGDDRFSAALQALRDHRIVDAENRFLPEILPVEAAVNEVIVVGVDTLTIHGQSRRRACATMAAMVPIRAASFASAVKRTEDLYREVDYLRRRGLWQLSRTTENLFENLFRLAEIHGDETEDVIRRMIGKKSARENSQHDPE